MPAIFSPSRSDIAPMVAEDEGLIYGGSSGANYPLLSGNYAAGSVTFAIADDGFWTIDSPVPMQMEAETITIDPHNTTFSEIRDLIGTVLRPIQFTTPVYCNSTPATAPRWIDALTCCAVDYSTPGSTVSSFLMTPATLRKQRSSVMAVEYDGKVYEAKGVVGTGTFRGTAGGRLDYSFQGAGIYQAAQHGTMTAVYTGTWDGGDESAAAFLNVGCSIRRNTNGVRTPYTPVLQEFEFALNTRISRIRDAVASTGLKMLFITGRRPTLRLTIAMDVDSAPDLTKENIESDIRNKITWDVYVSYTDTNSRGLRFSYPKAQPTRVTVTPGNDGVRFLQIDLKLTKNATAGDDEFYILQS